MKKKLLTSLVVAVAVVMAVPALGAEVTPETYKAEVEPICKRNVEANEAILKGVRQNVKTGKLKKASQQVFAAAKALKKAWMQLGSVPKPAEDEAKLTKWLKGIKTEVEQLEATGRKLAQGDKNGALKMVVRLESNARQINNLVLDYEFRYCRYQPGKFF